MFQALLSVAFVRLHVSSKILPLIDDLSNILLLRNNVKYTLLYSPQNINFLISFHSQQLQLWMQTQTMASTATNGATLREINWPARRFLRHTIPPYPSCRPCILRGAVCFGNQESQNMEGSKTSGFQNRRKINQTSFQSSGP